MSEVAIARISETPLDIAGHFAAVQHAHAGAVASFIGTVRDHDPDAQGQVLALEYSHHPDAPTILAEIARAAAGDRAVTVAVSHRVGRLEVGEAAVVVAVSSAHRDDAFTVCRDVIERLKTDLPVWKRQHESDGQLRWKGIGG